MNRLLVLMLLLVAAFSVAACGSDDDDGDGGSGSGSQASAGAFPVTIEHKFGKTEIKAEPKRVVNVGYTEQDTLLALGVKPVATRDFLGGYDYKKRPWAQEALGGQELPTVGGEQINFESVAAQRPDLIIAVNTGMTKGDYGRLSKIAPTIAQSGDYVDFGMPWQEQTVHIGRAVGREDQAREQVREVEAKFEEARREHPEFEGAPAILAYGGPEGYGAYSSQDTRSRFFTDLGFELPKEIDKIAGKAFFTELSQERFRLIDRDLVVMFGPQKEIEENKVFGRLNAVKEDRVVYLDLDDQFAGALGFSSTLSLPWLLENELDTLVAAVDGKTSTKVEQPK